VVLASTLGWILRVVVGVALLVGLYVIGAAMIRQFTADPAPEPDPDDTVPVDLRYRCSVCGAEVVMTAAQDEDPDPPRHCREPMALV
jgi:hypothetical protein